MDERIPGFKTGMIGDEPRAFHADTRTLRWVRLKRLIGLTPATPLPDQEGQIRYDRAAASTEGYAYLAKQRADDSRAWHRFLTFPYGTPTITALAGLGATGTASIVGNDRTGTITVVPGGAGIAAGSIVTVTFAVARPDTNFTVLTQASNTGARALTTPLVRASRTTTTVTLANATILVAGTTYTWDYTIEGY